MSKIHVIGIGYRPLDEKASDIVFNAGVILASERLFDVFKRYGEFEKVKENVQVIHTVDETFRFMHDRIAYSRSPASGPGSLVLLADGDPMFFGIGRRTVREFGSENVEIIPDLSSIQVAFSRIKEPWDNAFLMSLHGGPDPGKRRKLDHEIQDVPSLLLEHGKLGILTDKENNPPVIAGALLNSSGLSRFGNSRLSFYVCERLGYPEERITKGCPEDMARQEFPVPNVVILILEGQSEGSR
jgi:precorrin-6Y C5,15-methyltransferase (decarboxylating)